jgi:hypothetical protein
MQGCMCGTGQASLTWTTTLDVKRGLMVTLSAWPLRITRARSEAGL